MTQYYWLIDGYALRAVGRSLASLVKANRAEPWIHQLIRNYLFLIEQPLADTKEIRAALERVDVAGLADENRIEDAVLLSHIIELIWFRTTGEGTWIAILDKWLKNGPKWAIKLFEDLKLRLQSQTALTAPSPNFPPITEDETASTMKGNRLADLWLHILFNNAEEIDRLVKTLNCLTDPDTPLSKMWLVDS